MIVLIFYVVKEVGAREGNVHTYIEAVLSVLAGHFLPLVFNWFFKRNGHILSFVYDVLKVNFVSTYSIFLA